jgi:hypothetical protein
MRPHWKKQLMPRRFTPRWENARLLYLAAFALVVFVLWGVDELGWVDVFR